MGVAEGGGGGGWGRRELDGLEWLTSLSRRVQHYGHVFDYVRRAVDFDQPCRPLPAGVQAVADRAIRQGLMAAVDQCTVNEYLPGQVRRPPRHGPSRVISWKSSPAPPAPDSSLFSCSSPTPPASSSLHLISLLLPLSRICARLPSSTLFRWRRGYSPACETSLPSLHSVSLSRALPSPPSLPSRSRPPRPQTRAAPAEALQPRRRPSFTGARALVYRGTYCSLQGTRSSLQGTRSQAAVAAPTVGGGRAGDQRRNC